MKNDFKRIKPIRQKALKFINLSAEKEIAQMSWKRS